MRRAAFLLAMVATLATACGTVPARAPLAAGTVTVDILDRDAATGKVRLALENGGRERLVYLWEHVVAAPEPLPGQRATPWDIDSEDAPAVMANEIPLRPGERQIVEFGCPADGLCRTADVHVGIHFCRMQDDFCSEYEIVWSATTIATARQRQRQTSPR